MALPVRARDHRETRFATSEVSIPSITSSPAAMAQTTANSGPSAHGGPRVNPAAVRTGCTYLLLGGGITGGAGQELPGPKIRSYAGTSAVPSPRLAQRILDPRKGRTDLARPVNPICAAPTLMGASPRQPRPVPPRSGRDFFRSPDISLRGTMPPVRRWSPRSGTAP